MICRSGIATLVLTGLVLSSSPATASVPKERRARIATRYMIEHQSTDGSFQALSGIGSTADAIVSLVAARRGPTAIRDAVAFLENNEGEVDTIGELAKVAQALTAAGSDPPLSGAGT